jgi:plastocyanin
MIRRRLALLVPVLLWSSSGGAATLSGRVVLLDNGTPRGDASNAVVWIEGLRRGSSSGAVAEMKSEKKRFNPRVVSVSKNGAIDFPNVDPIYHNVFSVSPGNRFDLGLYRSGASKKQDFAAPGLVRVYCNIHPQMVGFVMVVDSDFSAVTGPDGAFRFDGVPAGTHVVRAWHEEAPEVRVEVPVRGAADPPTEIRLDLSGYRPQPHKNKYGKDYPPLAAADDERY